MICSALPCLVDIWAPLPTCCLFQYRSQTAEIVLWTWSLYEAVQQESAGQKKSSSCFIFKPQLLKTHDKYAQASEQLAFQVWKVTAFVLKYNQNWLKYSTLLDLVTLSFRAEWALIAEMQTHENGGLLKEILVPLLQFRADVPLKYHLAIRVHETRLRAMFI